MYQLANRKSAQEQISSGPKLGEPLQIQKRVKNVRVVEGNDAKTTI